MSPARSIAAAVQGGQDPLQEVEAACQRATADGLNAVIRVYEESAHSAVEALRARLSAGEQPPLAGVPVLLKDNLCYQDHPSEACSRILAGWRAPYTATAVARLQQAGAVIIGATNMDEFAMGSSNETSCHGPVRNPHDESRIPGGSSGGSAAAVAAGIAPLALGSDTGGSIRQPAALCGCLGMKPSYGRVSRLGLLAFASSLDQIGPLSTDAADAHAALAVLAAHDRQDSTSHPTASDGLEQPLPTQPLQALNGTRIGWIPAHAEQMDPAMAAHLERALERCRAAGAEIVEVALPHERYAVAIYYIVATGEASSNLARYDGVHYGHRSQAADSLQAVYARSRAEGFGTEVKRRIMLGTYALSTGYYDAYYKKAMQVRRLLCQDYERCFADCDLLLGLTSPTTAFGLGERTTDPLAMYLSDVFTIAANLAGIPAASVPWARHSDGLPVGLHLQAPMWQDHQLLAAAAALETLAD